MKFLHSSFWVELRLRLCSRMFLVLGVLLVLLLCGLKAVETSPKDPWQITAGVAYQSSDEFSRKLAQRLESLGLITFVPLEDYDEQQLVELVEDGSYEVVYQLTPELEQRLKTGKLVGCIPSYVSSVDGLSKFIDKWVLAAALIESSPAISTYEISKALGIPEEQVQPVLEESFRWFQENYKFVGADTMWNSDSIATVAVPEPIAWIRMNHGVVALLLFLLALGCLVSQMQSRQLVAARLKRKQQVVFCFSSFLSVWAALLLLGTAGILCLQLLGLHPRSGGVELVMLASYCMFLAGVSTCFSRLLRNQEPVGSSGIFLLLLLMVLGGVFYDPAEVASWLVSIAKVFPTYYYTAGIVTSAVSVYALPLLLGGIISLAVAVGLALAAKPQKG